MSGLIIDSEACIGCGRCVRACASGGIVVEGERPSRCARVTDGCILCGGCVDACPVNAISIERDEAAGAVDLDAYRDIWVFAQTDERDTVAPVAYELMGKGRELADARGCRLVALVGMGPEGSLGDLEHLVCAGADEVLACRDERLRQNDAEVYARLICDLVAVDLDAYRDIWVFAQTDERDTVAPVAYELMGKGRELADARGCRLVALVGMGPEGSLGDLEHLVCAGADEVLACRDERLRQNDAEVYARLICDLVAERKPEAILYGATAFGRELAPGVAVRLQTGLTADCTVLSMDAETGLLQQTRPAFGGNLMATIVCPNHRPQMATVRPGIFKAPDFDYGRSGTITQISLADDAKARVEISIPAEEWGQQASIADAERLVVVGRGIGSKKNLPLMRRLAGALGAELGCTRPVVEAGWLEYRHQIGQTGVSVSPKLLVSIGVSGAIQHLAGIGGAECIIAINEDPDAPIFGAAQYKVVGDAVEVVEELLAQLEH